MAKGNAKPAKEKKKPKQIKKDKQQSDYRVRISK
jgi:hypothetical protein